MLTLHPLCVDDILAIEPQPEQSIWFASQMTPQMAAYLANGDGRTAKIQDKIIMCCGVIHMHAGLAHAWTLLSADASPHMFGIVKAVRHLLNDVSPYRRLEMSIRAGFASGHKWAGLLGFEQEAVMRCYGEDGEDHHLYARIRP